jgi:hypothetical protein
MPKDNVINIYTDGAMDRDTRNLSRDGYENLVLIVRFILGI